MPNKLNFNYTPVEQQKRSRTLLLLLLLFLRDKQGKHSVMFHWKHSVPLTISLGFDECQWNSLNCTAPKRHWTGRIRATGVVHCLLHCFGNTTPVAVRFRSTCWSAKSQLPVVAFNLILRRVPTAPVSSSLAVPLSRVRWGLAKYAN